MIASEKRTTASFFSTPKPSEIYQQNLENVSRSTRKSQKTVEKSHKSAFFVLNSPKTRFLPIFEIIACSKALFELITDIYVWRPESACRSRNRQLIDRKLGFVRSMTSSWVTKGHIMTQIDKWLKWRHKRYISWWLILYDSFYRAKPKTTLTSGQLTNQLIWHDFNKEV